MTSYAYLNSNTLLLTNLREMVSEDPITSGVTVSAALCARGTTTPITGGTITLSYIAGTDSDWEGTFPSNLAVTLGTEYDVLITVDGGVLRTAVWRMRVTVRERRP